MQFTAAPIVQTQRRESDFLEFPPKNKNKKSLLKVRKCKKLTEQRHKKWILNLRLQSEGAKSQASVGVPGAPTSSRGGLGCVIRGGVLKCGCSGPAGGEGSGGGLEQWESGRGPG